ncbi:MAG: methyltransferase domain-containing protein [bacterium]
MFKEIKARLAPFRLQERVYEPELMDDPGGDQRLLFRTLKQFERINPLVTPNRRVLRQFVLSDMERGMTASLLDIGAGGGDFARWAVDQARRRGLTLRVVCIDNDERVARFCRNACRDYPEIETRCMSFEDVTEQFDYVFCNHVVHHFTEKQVAAFFDAAFHITRRRLIVSDLRRVWWAVHGFRLLATFAFRDSFARKDGPASIRRAFRAEEIAPVIRDSKWGTAARVRCLFPARLLLIADHETTGLPTGLA